MSVEILTSDAAESGFFVAMILFILSEFIGVAVIPMLKRHGSPVQRKNRGSNALVLFSWIVALMVAQLFAKSDLAILPSWAYYLGIALMLAGIAIRQWSIAVLGRFFSGVIGVQEGQKVVESGPYRLVRHPSYSGALLIMVGIGLAFAILEAACDRPDLCDMLWIQNVRRGKSAGGEPGRQLHRIHEEDKKG